MLGYEVYLKLKFSFDYYEANPMLDQRAYTKPI
jgi:hypothetical protein